MYKELEISSIGVALFFIGIVIMTICLIVFFRLKYDFYKLPDLIDLNRSKKSGKFYFLTKFPEIDVFKLSGSFFNYGLAVAVGFSLIAISWTTYEKPFRMELIDLNPHDEVEIEVPRLPEPPAPLPPPPPVIVEVSDAEPLEESPVFLDNSITEDTKMEPTEAVENKPFIAPPLPPAEETTVEEIVRFADQMPRFPGCEDKISEEDKKKCSETALMQYLYKNLKFPALAKEVGVDGSVVIQFVVDKEGSINNVQIVRDIGAGCGDAAATVIRNMNELPQKWTPGKQRGRPVKVLYTLPVKFKLDH